MTHKRLRTTKTVRASSCQSNSGPPQHIQNKEQSISHFQNKEQPVSSLNNVHPLNEEVEQVTVPPKAKKLQGYTRIAEIWDLNKEEQVIVDVNAHHIPIGDSAAKLTRFIGTMVRMFDFAPLNYTTWSQLPIRKKEEMWVTVKSRRSFNLKHWTEKWL
ncbi:unnamed protein product [Cuscuta epithymum]|uniref:Uncharacterized protein n=1 Tax=Cuscuta epithymum TaxID=186058 RepID=A0AAV0G2P0_9ASTE|nr:unnamed protein product [Cuscuta epithymum]